MRHLDIRSLLVGLVTGLLVGGVFTGLAFGGDDREKHGAVETAVPSITVPPSPTIPEVEVAPEPSPSPEDPKDGEDSEGGEGGEDEEENDRKPAEALPIADAAPAGEGPLPADEPVTCPTATITVSDGEELAEALTSVAPGDVVELEPGVYEGEFVMGVSGTESEPIFLCGSAEAELHGGDIDGGYTLHIDGADHVRLVGFSVTGGQKGVMADGTVGSVIQGLTVSDIGDEAIHLRSFSTDNLVIGNTITRTGLRRDKFGEGVYIGSAVSNWCRHTDCQADRSDRNVVKGNTITGVSSEAVDIKEGTTGGAVLDNTFDGTGMTGADSWVDVKGNNYLIAGNRGVNAPEDGMQTHQILPGWGDHNVFSNNDLTVNGPGNAISSWPPESNVVKCDNTFSAAGEGLSNIECTS